MAYIRQENLAIENGCGGSLCEMRLGTRKRVIWALYSYRYSLFRHYLERVGCCTEMV